MGNSFCRFCHLPSNFPPRPGRRAAHKAIASHGLSMLPKLHVDHVDLKVLIQVWWFRGLEVQKPWNVLLEETLRFEIQAFKCSFQYVGVWAIHNQRPLVLCVWFSSILSGDMFLRARSTNSSNSYCRPCHAHVNLADQSKMVKWRTNHETAKHVELNDLLE